MHWPGVFATACCLVALAVVSLVCRPATRAAAGLSEDEKNWLFAKMLQEGGYGPAGGHFVDEEDESNEAVEELSTFYQDVLGSEGGMDVLVAPPPSATAAAADAAPATAYIPSSASRLSAGAAEFRPGAWAAAAAFVPAASAPAPAPASAGYSWVDPYAQPAAVEHPQYAQQQYGHLQYPQQRQPQATWADHARGSAGPAAAAMPAHGGGGGGMWSSGPATSQPAPAAWPAPYAAGPAPATMAPRPALQQSGAQPPRADWQVSLGSLM